MNNNRIRVIAALVAVGVVFGVTKFSSTASTPINDVEVVYDEVMHFTNNAWLFDYIKNEEE